MSVVLPVLIIIAVLVGGIFLWKTLPEDRVGRTAPNRRFNLGFQGQLTEYLVWDAALQRPRPDKLAPPRAGETGRVMDRALYALVHRHAVEKRLSPKEALLDLRKHTSSRLARAFLDGKMGQANRIYWRRRYRGPDGLFGLWYYFVAAVRHGRRQLTLETLAATLQEMRNP